MKPILRIPALGGLLLLMTNSLFSQCGAGWNSAVLNWDNLDYLVTSGNYSGYVTTAVRDNQSFGLGINRVTFALNGITPNGENATNTAESGSYGSGEDAEFSGSGTITLTFDTVVKNLTFSLYDIDYNHRVAITAVDGSANPLSIDMSVVTAGVVTITGSGTTTPVAAASNTGVGNTDTRGTVNVSVGGGSDGVKSVVLTFSNSTSGFWMSDLTACVYGSFPTNYYASQKPFTGQPGYFLVTPDNNSVYVFNPVTGEASWLFAETSSPWVNSLAYDHVHHIVYYVMDNPSPKSTNTSLKKYDLNTETSSTVIADVRTLGIPLFDIVVESAGAAFYNGSLYLGIEGTNNSHKSGRESIIWKIDFDASQNPTRATQVFARPADNGSGRLTHDWGDFSIKDGVIYDFNTGNTTSSPSTAEYVHFNMQNGNTTIYPVDGSTEPGKSQIPIQVGQLWNGDLYWVGDRSGQGGRAALYNEDGTIGAKVVNTADACSPSWAGQTGDASDPIRPKSDFGDAPASYDPDPSAPATHEYDCNLRLGATYGREWDKTPSVNADADPDEDCLPTPPVFTHSQTTYDADVDVYNNTGSDATVAAWIDFDNNGTFDASEGVTVTVNSNASTQSIHLTWTGMPAIAPSVVNVYMRIRVTSQSNGMTISNATGYYPNGEVEDYLLSVTSLLPAKLVSFEAYASGDHLVDLNWSATAEYNLKKYIVEKSKDGVVWERLVEVAPKTVITAVAGYAAQDEKPFPDVTWYRLKMEDANGKVAYSPVRKVNFHKDNIAGLVTPNPFSDAIRIQVKLPKAGTAEVRLLDYSGKVVRALQVNGEAGLNNWKLSDLRSLPNGLYLLDVESGQQQLIRQKLFKQ